MRITIDSFRGEVPRLTPRALPENAAQAAVNCKLLSGDLESWRQFLNVKSLAHAGDVETIYLLNDKWLSWPEQVDVARGLIPGDASFRTYLTAPQLYGSPRFTNYALATTGPEPYPVLTRPLGVPAPDAPPTVAVVVADDPQSNLTVTNAGAEVGAITGWTVSAGSLVVIDNGAIAGLNAQAGTRFFGGGSAALSKAYQDIDIEAEGVLAGQGLKLSWYQATGAAGSTAAMEFEFYDASNALIATVAAEQLAPGAPLTWERRETSAQVPTGAVTARVIQHFVRVGAGPAIDAYIDAVSLSSVAYTNFFDGSSLYGWTVSPKSGTVGEDDRHRDVYIDAAYGWGAPGFHLQGDEMVPWMHRDFGTNNSPAVRLEFDYQQYDSTGHGLQVVLFGSASGRATSLYLNNATEVALLSATSWDDYGTRLSQIPGSAPHGQRLHVTLTTEQTSATEAQLTVRVVDVASGGVLVNDERVKVLIEGPHIGFKANTGGLNCNWIIDNVSVTVAAPRPRDEAFLTATSYVYRFVNDLGEASAPSPASNTVIRPDGGTALVTTPIDVPTGIGGDYAITHKQIFRSVSGAGGVAFVFVTEIPLATEEFVDAYDDSQIAGNDVLDSETWDLPPADLEGIRALPNGIMVGFRRNQLCFSAQNRPHAWPVGARLTTDTDIVAISNIDTTVVVTTQSFLYTASGTSPESYTMSQPGVAQAGVSKRAIANLLGGVVFASPDGAMLAAGPTQVSNLTAALFTRQQWQALDPSSMLFVVQDDVLHVFFSALYAPGAGPGCYMIDAKPNGFGAVRMGYHATAAHADPLTDALYLVLDDVDEPTSLELPEPSSAPTPDDHTIYQFDGDDSQRMVFRWRGKLNLLPWPACLQMLQAKAQDFDNLVLRLHANGSLLFERALTSQAEFTLPMSDSYSEFEIELIGTSRTRTVQAAEDVVELV